MEDGVIENVDSELVMGDVIEIEELVVERKENKIILPPQEFLIECFKYVADTGEFRWKIRPIYHFKSEGFANHRNSEFANREILTIDKNGYYKVCITYEGVTRKYVLAKIIWKIIYGKDAVNSIININGIRTDNRLINLQEHIPSREKITRIKAFNKNKKPIHLPSKEYFEKYLKYDKETGKLFWRVRDITEFKNDGDMKRWNSNYSNKQAGGISKQGYSIITIDRNRYNAHRVIWLMCHNEDPKDLFIDHINGIRNDNRIENLRLANSLENARHQTRLATTNTTGYRGVYKGKKEGTWSVRLNLDGEFINIGTFYNLNEAIEARRKAVDEHYGEFAGIV